MAAQGWRLGLICSRSQINLDILLNCGQSFRWKRKNEVEWIGVIQDHVWHLRQTGSGILYIVYGEKPMMNKQPPDGLPEHCLKETMASSEHSKNKNVSIELSQVKLEPNDNTHNPIGQELNSIDKADIKSKHHHDEQFMKKKVSSRKRAVVKTEYGDYEVPKKHVISEITTEGYDLISKKFSCLLPSVLLKTSAMKLENLKEIYIKEDIKFEDDREYLHQSESCENVLRDYFQADIDLCDLYDHWSSKDSHFKDVAAKFEGIRMLRQDPTENLLSFVCSSNNHISRISSMVEKLCVHYGTYITEVDGEKYYSFPTMSALTSDSVEGHLRQLGFGYRAKFISAIAKYITQEKDEGWLEYLRDECSYKEAKSELMKLLGVGAKVADCVCLMSLDKPESVPVDTHVWQITLKNYMAKLQNAKSLTERIYNEIGAFYRELWGPYAGWAHSVLFTADLKHNKTKEVSDNSTEKEKSQKTSKGHKRKSNKLKS